MFEHTIHKIIVPKLADMFWVLKYFLELSKVDLKLNVLKRIAFY